MENRKLWKWLCFTCVALITITSGIYNFAFWGSTSIVTSTNMILSVLTYILWLISSVLVVRASMNPVQTSMKITFILVVCFIMALPLSPLAAIFISPIMGICMTTIHHIDPFWMAALLYIGIVTLDWLVAGLKIYGSRRDHTDFCKT